MTLRAHKINPAEFDPAQRAFPFTGTPYKDARGLSEIAPGVYLDADGRTLTFALQRGAVREVGRNGCDVLDMIECSRLVLEVFQAKVPSRETALAITKLQEAEMWLRERTRDREERGVEGTMGK